MTRRIATILVFLVAAALVVPGISLAAKGGQPGPPNGIAPGQARAAQSSVVEDGLEDEVVFEGVEEEPEEGRGNGWGKLDRDQRREAREQARAERQAAREDRPTGIGNALSRIAANIAKAEAKIALGKKKSVPSGLVAAFAKFSSWLGLLDGGSNDGSDNASGTVDPDDSNGASETVEPLDE